MFPIQSKSEVIVVMRNLLARIKNFYCASVKVLRIDNGCEFFSTEFQSMMSSLGILHQISCVYTPQQHGVVERKYRTILDVARVLTFRAVVPLNFGVNVSLLLYIFSIEYLLEF